MISHPPRTGWQSFWSRSADVLRHGRRSISHLSPTGRARNTSITRQWVCGFGDTRIIFAVFEGWTFVFDFPSLESILGESIDLQQTETPRLQFFDERIFRIGSLLAAECTHPGEHSDLYGDSLVTALVIGFLRFGRDRAQEKKQGTLAPWQLHRAKEFMEANLSTGVQLRDLAEITRLSQSQFGRAFKASTGLAPHQWQMNLRINRAQQLLLDGELSLAQIALVTGFSEQSHFTRVFRRLLVFLQDFGAEIDEAKSRSHGKRPSAREACTGTAINEDI